MIILVIVLGLGCVALALLWEQEKGRTQFQLKRANHAEMRLYEEGLPLYPEAK